MADRNNPDDELELTNICDSQSSQEKSSSSDKNVQASCVCYTKRWIVAVLIYFGFFITSGMRYNTLFLNLRGLTEHTGWLYQISYFWSYLLTQFPGGILTSIYPAYRIFGIAVLCSSVLNLLIPELSTLHPIPVIVIQSLQGIFEGLLFPACYGMIRFWIPPSENSRFVTLVFSIEYAGMLVGCPLSAILTKIHHWNLSFYVYGAFGIVWFLFWNRLVFERPASHPNILLEEKSYIEQSLGGSESKVAFKTVPWRNIFTSMPVYAIIVANFCRSWTFCTFVIFQVLDLPSLLNIKTEYRPYLTLLPFLVLVLVVPIGGVIADFIRNKNILSTTNVRKVFSCGGLAVQGLLFLMLAYFVKTATEVLILLNVGVAFGGLALTGFNVNHFDIAPRYASLLMGLSHGIGTTADIFSPIAIQSFLGINYDLTSDWTYVFLSGACVHLIGIMFYAIFASGELQPWAEPKSSTSSDPDKSADDKTQLASCNIYLESPRNSIYNI